MASITWTLWKIVVFQLLIGEAVTKEINTNSLRGRSGGVLDYNEQFETRSHTEADRDLIEEPTTGSLFRERRNFPFLASLMDTSFNHICGATFIARDMLLTAASCGKRARLAHVHFHDGGTNEYATLDILATFTNPSYDELTGEHNTMVIQLANRVGAALSSPTEPSDIVVQVMLHDAEAGRPMGWPIPILREGQTLTAFNYAQEWKDWKLPYIGRDACKAKIEESGEFVKSHTPKDSFCLAKPDVELSSSASASLTCYHGDIGGPILWKSDTTGARLLVGINTWGIGCRSLTLPDFGNFANSSGEFIRETVCAKSFIPPSYLGCPPVVIEGDKRNPVISSVFSDFFGGDNIIKGSLSKTTTSARIDALVEEIPEPVTVFLLLNFDVTTAEHVSWTISEAFTKRVVVSVNHGTYTSKHNVVELVQLVPGKFYQIKIADDSIVSTQDRCRGTRTEFSLVASEPPLHIESGNVTCGLTRSSLFKVPEHQWQSPEVLVGNALPPVTESPSESTMSPTPEPSFNPSLGPVESLESSSPTNSPSFHPVEPPSSTSPTDIPSLSPLTTPSMLPSMPPSDDTPDLVSPAPSPSPTFETPYCAAKGESCASSADCCDGRCSPQKTCYANDASNRQRVAPRQHGGAAGNISRRKRLNKNN